MPERCPVARLARCQACSASSASARRSSSRSVWLECHNHWLAWSGTVLGQAEGQLGWAAYHRAAGNPCRPRPRRACLAPRPGAAPPALLAAHRMLGELDTAAGTSADAAAHLNAALALADACAAPYERALTLLALAELRAADGKPGAGGTALDEARAILDPWTPPRPRPRRALAPASPPRPRRGPHPPPSPSG